MQDRNQHQSYMAGASEMMLYNRCRWQRSQHHVDW